MNKLWKITRVFVLIFLLLPVVIVYRSYVYHGEQVGKVIDTTTGEPIEGAIIVQETTGHKLIVMSVSFYCVNAAVAVSDEAGNYQIPSWSKFSYKLAVDERYTYRTRVYKAGYEFDMLTGNTIYMKPFVGSKIERAKQLSTYVGICKTGDGLNNKDVTVLLRAMLKEAQIISGKNFDGSIGEVRLYKGNNKDLQLQYDIAVYTYNAIQLIEGGKFAGE